MDVSIIIVNYRTVDLIRDAIDSIIKETVDIQYEIIIVDNCSGDNSQQILENLYSTRIKYVPLSKNLGFGKANNEGLLIAKGRNILFLNPDTVLLNNAIKILSDTLDNNEIVGACGGNLYNSNLQPTTSYCMFFPSIFDLFRMPLKLFYGKNRLHNFSNKCRDVAYVIGADMMIKSSILKYTNGAFSPHFFMYYEEIEFCHRIKKLGYKILSVPSANIQHLESQSIRNIRRKAIWHYTSEMKYYELTHSKFYFKMYKKIYSLISMIEMMKSSKGKYKYEFSKIKKDYHKNQI